VVGLTATIRLGGVGGCLAFDGTTSAVTFKAYVEHVLAPALKPGDIVVMDNLKARKGPGVERPIKAAGAELRLSGLTRLAQSTDFPGKSSSRMLVARCLHEAARWGRPTLRNGELRPPAAEPATDRPNA